MYTFTSDPGHGWLAVPKIELTELGIADKISPYSYDKDGTVYLEEDMDAGTFFDAYKTKHGENPKFVERNVNHTAIRSYPSYYHPNYKSPFSN